MKGKYLLVAILVLLLVMIAVPVNSLPARPVHQLVFGKVELKRLNWPKQRVVGPIQQLYLEDWVKAQQSDAKVLCASIRVRTIPQQSTPVKQLCSQAEPATVKSGDSLVGRPRGGTDPLIPYIVSPRRTWLLDNKPLIRWNAVPNATRYTVRLRGAAGVIWQTEVTATEVTYPGNPPLRPNVPYALVVQADTGTSSADEGIPGLGFQVMAPAEAQRIAAEVTQITQTDLSSEAQVLTLAHLYDGEGLAMDAIRVLEGFIAKGNRRPAVYRFLGDLFRQVRLNLSAKDAYLQAVELAKTEGDLEALAEAQVALGEVYIALKDRTVALRWLEQARSGYIELEGDQSARVREITEQIATLQP